MSNTKILILMVSLVAIISMGNALADQSRKMLHKNPFIKPSDAFLDNANDSETSRNQLQLGEMILRGTLSSDTHSIANINGEMIMVGELINGFELKQVNIGSAVLMKNGKEELLVVNEKYEKLK